MLSEADKLYFAKQWNEGVKALGVPATHVSTEGIETQCIVGFKTARDEEIINSWGIGVRIVTIRAAEVSPVKKLDRVFIMDQTYTLDAVDPVMLNDIFCGWRCYVRGK
jgi:hypothetical protein